jgi:polar amino acid transport system substrate-binding protein
MGLLEGADGASAKTGGREMFRQSFFRYMVKAAAGAAVALGLTAQIGLAQSWEDSPTVQNIKKEGVLRAGVSIAAPTIFKDPSTGELEGILIQIGKEAAKRLGVKLEVSETGWDTIIAGLQANKYDVALAGLFETEQRKKVVDFVTFGEEGIGFLVRKDNDAINTVDDLNKSGVTIATVTGSGSEQMIKDNFKESEIKSVISPTGGSGAPPEEVIAGRVDAAQFDAVLALAYQERFPDLKVVPADAFEKPLFPTPTGIAVRKDDPKFREFLASVIADLEKDGQILAWREKWSKPELLLN